MSSVAESTAAAPAPPAAPAPRRRRTDLLVALLALVAAFWVTGGLWLDPDHGTVQVNIGDQALFEWNLAYAAHALTHLENPFFTHLLNVPDGVNLTVNTAMTVYGFVFAPLTMGLGPQISFLVILTLNLAATAYAWYWLLSRHLVRSRTAAIAGGLFCGFAPGLVSHANAHLNWTAQWIVPLLVWRVLRMRRWRDGIAVGLLVAVMFSIASEGLFFAVLALAVFIGCWSARHRRQAAEARPGFLRGLAVTALVGGVLLAYPLWLHFFGAQGYHGTGFDPRVHAEDVLAYGAFPQRSLAGLAGLGTRLAANPTEENSFFGLPLLVLAVACAVRLWRRPVVPPLAITAGVFAVLSLGPRLRLAGHLTPIPLPYAALVKLPLFDAALPARLALVLVPIIGLLLAYTLDLRGGPGAPADGRGPLGPRWLAGFVVALLPLAPVPLLTVDRSPIPRFFTSGVWREYVTTGRGGEVPVIAPVPPASDLLADGQRWQASALAAGRGEFAIPAGFFLGPGGPDGRGRIGPVPRPTAALLSDVAQSGEVPLITETDRRQALVDLHYWRAQLVVLADQVTGSKWTVHRGALLTATTQLLGPGERVAGVTLWRVPS